MRAGAGNATPPAHLIPILPYNASVDPLGRGQARGGAGNRAVDLDGPYRVLMVERNVKSDII
jgi:hypothetical protein